MSDLQPLPDSSDEYWTDVKAKTERIVVKETKCNHSFEGVASHQVECKHCKAGFFLSPGWTLKSEHVYFEDKLVV